jgi:hypothetical protein
MRFDLPTQHFIFMQCPITQPDRPKAEREIADRGTTPHVHQVRSRAKFRSGLATKTGLERKETGSTTQWPRTIFISAIESMLIFVISKFKPAGSKIHNIGRPELFKEY